MPERKSFDACGQTIETKTIPVVVVTADANQYEGRLLAAGVRTFLSKPLNVPLSWKH